MSSPILSSVRVHARQFITAQPVQAWIGTTALLLALALLAAVPMAGQSATADASGAAIVSPPSAKPLPLQFVPNVGQWQQPELLYLTRAADLDALFKRDHIELRLRDADAPAALRLRPLNAKVNALQPGAARVTVVNDYRGQDPARWHSGIPTYEDLRYAGLYPDIDLLFRTQERQLAYDFIVHPGADPAQIRIALDGAQELSIEPDGSLRALLPDGREFRQQPPMIYQERNGERELVSGRFQVLAANSAENVSPVYGFEIGDYDPSQVLVIDPTLVYSNFVGGSRDETVSAMEVTSAGEAIVVGTTASADFADLQPPHTEGLLGRENGFIYQMNANGTALDFVTLLGGSGNDAINDLAIDSGGNILVAGATASNDFPLVNPRFGVLQARTDAFVTKLNPTGQLITGPTGFSTYYGGDGQTSANAIALDGDDHIYIAGVTSASDLVLRNPWQAHLAGRDDGFIVQFTFHANASRYDIEYATYFGGSANDSIDQLIASDTSRFLISDTGDLFIAGHTSSPAEDRDGLPDFPIKHALQPVQGGRQDVFLARLSRGGQELLFSTYLGGSNDDFLTDFAMDDEQHYLLSGYTSSDDWPTHNALIPTYPEGSRNDMGTIAKVDRSGRFLHFSTYLGAAGDDRVLAVAPIAKHPTRNVDGKIYVAGITDSNAFPVKDAYQWFHTGNSDGFLVTLGASGRAINFSTYFGGTETDEIVAVKPNVLSPMDSVIFAGHTNEERSSVMFPTALSSPIFPHAGRRDTFVGRFDDIGIGPRPPVLWLETDLDAMHPEAASAPNPFPVTFKLKFQDRPNFSPPAVRGVTSFSTRLYYDPSELRYVDHVWDPGWANWKNLVGLSAAPIITTLNPIASGVLEIRLFWPPGHIPERIDGLVNGKGNEAYLADIEFELLGVGHFTDAPPLPSQHITVEIDQLSDASVEGELNETVTGLPGVQFVERRCDTLIGDCDCSCRVWLFEVQAGLENYLSRTPVSPPPPKDDVPVCMKLDYDVMTVVDLQNIISHYYRERDCSDMTTLHSGIMSCSSSSELLTFGTPTPTPPGHPGDISVDLILNTGNTVNPSLVSAVIDLPTGVTVTGARIGSAAASVGKEIGFQILNDELRLVVYDLGERVIPDGHMATIDLQLGSGQTINNLDLDMQSSAAATSSSSSAFEQCNLHSNSIVNGQVVGINAPPTTSELIASLYVSMFNRAPDEDGFNFWLNHAINSGLSDFQLMYEMATGFAAHPAFGQTYDHLSDDDFVQELYMNIGGSQGDSNGVNFWVSQINAGTSRADVVADFTFGVLAADLTSSNFHNLTPAELSAAQERQDHLQNRVDVSLAYIEQMGSQSNLNPATNPLILSSLMLDDGYLASMAIIECVDASQASRDAHLAFLTPPPSLSAIIAYPSCP